MKCEVVVFEVALNPGVLFSPSRICVQCNTHHMNDFSPMWHEGILCPVGKIEQAVEDGLEKIDAVLKAISGALRFNDGKTDAERIDQYARDLAHDLHSKDCQSVRPPHSADCDAAYERIKTTLLSYHRGA